MESSALITSVPRTEGDGMESLDEHTIQDLKLLSVTSAASALEALSIKPSPRTAERIISLVPTSSPLTVKPKTSIPGENKKLKFVPYEPYKAAVKPIIPLKTKPLKKVNSQNSISEHQEDGTKDKKSNTCCQQSKADLQAELEQAHKEKTELESQLKIQSKVFISWSNLESLVYIVILDLGK